MRFIPVRELRSNSAQIWKTLAEERDMIITSNGRPIAILNAICGDDFEESVKSIRSARALRAVASMQRRSAERGLDKMTLGEVNAVIRKVRRERRSRSRQ